jgi:short-subunit dehydrogenase
VNNAGIGVEGTPLKGEFEKWETMIQINLHAPMHLTRLVSPKMTEKKKGLIVNIASVAGVEPMKDACAYAATKHGLRGWSLSCYQHFRQYGIKVVCINPGMVASDMTASFGMDAKKMIQPEDIAAAVMLAVTTGQSCTPQEITIRPTEPVS